MQIYTNTEVTGNKKNNTNPNIYKNLTKIQKYHDRKHIYTDASKTSDSVGIAIVAENITITYKLPTECSIYTAKALAIYNAVLYILHNKETTPNNYLIISASLSSITGIQNTTHPSDISKIIQEKTRSTQYGDRYMLCIGTRTLWHTWNNPGLKRKEETILNRLRIGHTFIMHRHFMEKNDPPICEMCGVVYTFKHIITECQKYDDMRKKHQLSQQIGEALGSNTQSITKILQSIKKIQLYNLI